MIASWFSPPSLEYVAGGNTVRAYLVALLFAGFVLGLAQLYRGWVRSRLQRFAERTAGKLDDLVVRLFDRAFAPILGGSALLVLVGSLSTPRWIELAAVVVFLSILVYYAATSVLRLLDYALDRLFAGGGNGTDRHAREILGFFLRLGLWSLVGLLVVHNLGIDITSLLAGLGIGGIALALGVQSIVGDLFSYFAILVDRPFRLGDFLIVDEVLGTVERIGLKTTRLRALSGEQIILSNSDLLGSRIRNFRRLYERRVVFQVGVEYGTPTATLEKIPAWIRAAIEGADHSLRVDRVHLRAFGASSLDFEAVYFIPSSEYNDYMDAQQSILLAVYDKFRAEGVSFAFPTRTVHLTKSDRRPPSAP